MTLFDFDEMVLAQNGVCAICGSAPNGHPLHVDHDHTTGAVRGLLCQQCNTGLGNFRDDIALLDRAMQYLRGALLGAELDRVEN